MKQLMMSVAILSVLGIGAAVQAQCGASAGKSQDVVKASETKATGKSCCSKNQTAQKACCSKGTTAKSCCSKSQTAKACCGKAKADAQVACTGKALVMSGAPLMTYKVGCETTRCPKQAGEWAAKCDKSNVVYVFNGTEYTCKMTASKAWTQALNEYMSQMTSVRYAVGDNCMACPNAAKRLADTSGKKMKFRVASHTFDSKDDAARAAKLAREAASQVTMKMVIDGKEYSCCDTAYKQVADASSCSASGRKTAKAGCDKAGGKRVVEGKSCEYVLGEMKTACRTTAELELAKARVAAAQQALEEAAGQKVAGS
jgi:hypothetical protein